MSFEYIQEIPTPEVIFNMLPLDRKASEIKKERDTLIKKIFTNEDNRFLLIIGPCSADQETPVIDYVNRLSVLQDKVKDKLVLMPRIYTNKPRTTGEGYKGMVHQPNPNEASNMLEGILAIRRMHIRAILESGLTSADEMLYPENYAYLDDVLGYVAIGARSVENQQHRLTVSGLDVPVGMKNPTSGDITVMLNAIKAAQIEHNFIFRGWEVKTNGNPLVHAIMRGAVDQYGRNIPNYHYEDIMYLIEHYNKRALKYPSIIIDINHANSNKKYDQQPRIAMEIIKNFEASPEMKTYVKGLMVESYIEEGHQSISGGIYGKSITDPCLGWSATEKMVLAIADKLK